MRGLSFRRLFSFKTPRGPLPWPVLAALVLVTFVALWSVWTIAESEWLQWVAVVASLFVWNLLVVRAGDGRERSREDDDLPIPTAVVILLCGILFGVASIGVTAILTSVSEGWSLYPGEQAISFIVVSAPVLIWVNLRFQNEQGEG